MGIYEWTYRQAHGTVPIMESKDRRKNPHAAALGRLGGLARARALTPERRREIAQLGVLTRLARARAAKRSALQPKGGPRHLKARGLDKKVQGGRWR